VARNKANAAIKRDKLQEMDRKCKVFKTNKKAFYGFVRSKQISARSKLYMKNENGVVIETSEETAEKLSKFFGSVYVEEDTEEIPVFSPVDVGKPEDMGGIVITLQLDVFKTLSKLKEDKSLGPDDLHPMVLKRIANEWSQPFTILFQKSMESGRLPKKWKSAIVTPVYKEGCKA